MRVKRHGTGAKTFLGLHGWGADHRALEPVAVGVPEWASFYCADLPGCGDSPAPEQWQLGVIVNEIVDAVKGLGISDLTLIGNCSGANLAILTAKQSGLRISRLVLVDAFAVMPRYFKIFTAPHYGRYAYRSTFANPVGRWLTNRSLRSRRSENTDLTGSFATVDHNAAYQYLTMLGEQRELEKFRELVMPIDVVYGERTFAAVKRSVSQWQELWPHAVVHELKGSGHMPFSEATQQLSRIIFDGRGSV